MTTADTDVLDQLDYAFQRLTQRLEGLTDHEWTWLPTSDDTMSIRWRLGHLSEMFDDARNASWLGVPEPTAPAAPEATDAAGARDGLASSFARFRGCAGASDLDAQIGSIGGRFGESTHRAFVLHLADELIHHGAEVALLRDLYTRLNPGR